MYRTTFNAWSNFALESKERKSLIKAKLFGALDRAEMRPKFDIWKQYVIEHKKLIKA
jgi:hypothetical protein